LTAGALVLAVIAPSVETVEHPAEASSPPPPSVTPVAAQTPGFASIVLLPGRSRAGQRVSRSAKRRGAAGPPAAGTGRVVRVPARRMAAPVSLRRTAAPLSLRRTAAPVSLRRAVMRREAAVRRRASRAERRVRRFVARVAALPSVVGEPAGGMAAVIAFARSQIGKGYTPGGDGPNGFDCSGLTQRAYAKAGLRLPHSAGAQAARARAVSRSRARPGDLVVGPGHVGVYMGGGMMIDAGNRRTGVVYRHLYAGLHLERF
jgi:cell wall-associated NlpC family hydrolase